MGIRPIVSSCQSPTENISQFIDFWLQPHVKTLNSFLRDSSQFIIEVENLNIPVNSLLVTIDVTSLYTNIPHNEGIKACHEAFLKLENQNIQQPPAEILTDLIEIVLKNNTFEFNGKCYKQLFGTAMGTKLAPAYANTFLGNLEDKFLKNEPHKPLYYRRFIDDIFMIWPYTLEQLHEFMQRMNQIHPSMKFTFEHSYEQITYLDTNVHVNKNLPCKLFVTTHIKDTNKQAYTYASSYHPPGTGKGIAIGEALRYARINTFKPDFDRTISQHIRQMAARGYTSDFIKSSIKSVQHKSRFKRRTPKTNNRPVFVTRFTASASRVIKIIRHNWHHIQNDSTVGKFFPQQPLMAFKKNTNLKQYLVRARINPDADDQPSTLSVSLDLEHQPITVTPKVDLMNEPKDSILFCPIRNCFLHKYLNKSLRIICSITKRSFRVRGKITCNSKNIIYLIQCSKCKKQYVGQTSTCLRHRISQHINNKSSTNSTVDQHFSIPGHTMTVQPIEQISTDHTDNVNTIRDKLYQRERYWINKLKSVYPQGLNWTSGNRPRASTSS